MLFLKLFFQITVFINILLLNLIADKCCDLKFRSNLKFYLWKSFQRSSKERLFIDNVDSLEACIELAVKCKGLALNYSPGQRFVKQRADSKSFRDHYWLQPHLYFNCHILQCPENDAFKMMVNDTTFDYYSIYEKPMASSDSICLPEVGLFMLHTIPETYENATLKCRHTQNHCGTLAHVASQKRTEALAGLIGKYNEQQALQGKAMVYLAYVGLQYNSTWSSNYDFFNIEKENLKCFAYRAWEPGNPKLSSEYANSSCVALTVNRSWVTVKCNRKLPFICELWTSCNDEKKYF